MATMKPSIDFSVLRFFVLSRYVASMAQGRIVWRKRRQLVHFKLSPSWCGVCEWVSESLFGCASCCQSILTHNRKTFSFVYTNKSSKRHFYDKCFLHKNVFMCFLSLDYCSLPLMFVVLVRFSLLHKLQPKFNASANICLSKQLCLFFSFLLLLLFRQRFPFNNDKAVFLWKRLQSMLISDRLLHVERR